jgi:Peptidase inhibitor I78 family
MSVRVILLGSVVLFLAGCALTTRGGPASGPQAAGELPPLGAAEDVADSAVRAPITGTCGMENLQHYVGQPRVNVPRGAMPDVYRVVGPNSVVTMDYRADRLTIRVNESDIVESLACG